MIVKEILCMYFYNNPILNIKIWYNIKNKTINLNINDRF